MSKSIKDLQMLSANEENIVKEQFNNTYQDYPRDKCVHTLFEEQVLKTPEKEAVIACDKTLTYDELNRLSNRIANSLTQKGVKVNDIVAFALPRRSFLIAVMFGILKSGAAYMPIDPDYPQERIEYMLSDSNAKLFITEDNLNEFVSDNEENPSVGMSSDNYCYCIYTSGSTGKPKGTILMHRNVANYVSNSQSNNVVFYSIANNCKTILSTTTVVFDIFVTESLMPLCNSMTIILANEQESTVQTKLNELVLDNPVDIMQTTPTKMKSLITDKQNIDYLKNLKVIILGGEALDENLTQRLQEISYAEIFNIYGPTETTVWSSNLKTKKQKINRVSDLITLTNKDENKINEVFNNTKADYPKDKCVHTLFEEQVLKTPEKTAVIACDKTLTYDELNKLSNRIANSLIEKGVKVNDIVAFALPRRSYLIAVMFGILKSGAAYMPIDPDYPQERIEYMLEDSDAKLFITEDNLNEFVSDNEENPSVEMTSDNYCYCIYTSGSTGKPKGTILMHRNVANLCNQNIKNCYLYEFNRNGKCVLSIFKICFDAFEFDVLLSLLNNKSLILANESEVSNGDLLADLISKHNVDVIHSTPTIVNMLCESEKYTSALKNIKIMMIAAEVFNESLCEKLKQYTNAKIFNGYGPSETTIGVSFEEIALKTNNQTIKDFWVISDKDENKIKEVFNNTKVDYPKDKCVHTLFEEQVLKTPEKTAVIDCDKTLTYDELNKLSNRIANSLIEKGVKVNDIVAFALPRRSYLIAVMFGILKSGAAYMPIDPDYPQDRIDYMISDSNAKFFITENNLNDFVSDNEENPSVEMTSDSYCYCIYTSGSTGKPKGTVIRHRNLNNFCDNNNNNYQTEMVRNGSCVISTFKTCFDAFGVDSILFILNGKTVVLTNESEISNGDLLADLISKHNVDVIHSTPTIVNMLCESEKYTSALKNIKIMMIAAEVFNESLCEKLKQYTDAKIFNGYGPSETTIGVSFGEIKEVNINEEV